MTAETLETTVDVVVIGMGVAGEAVAGDLAASGLDVIGVESHLVGGECPYWGCIPTKMMVRAAGLIAEIRRVEGLAGTATVSQDWAQVAQRIRDEATDDWTTRWPSTASPPRAAISYAAEHDWPARGLHLVRPKTAGPGEPSPCLTKWLMHSSRRKHGRAWPVRRRASCGRTGVWSSPRRSALQYHLGTTTGSSERSSSVQGCAESVSMTSDTRRRR